MREKVVPRDAKATDFPAQFERVLKALNVEAALRTLCINNVRLLPHLSLCARIIDVGVSQHTVPLTAITDLRTKWDFSRVGVQLVASLAGKHEGWPKVIHTGHPALMKAVRDLGARSGGRKLAVECQVRPAPLASARSGRRGAADARGRARASGRTRRSG